MSAVLAENEKLAGAVEAGKGEKDAIDEKRETRKTTVKDIFGLDGKKGKGGLPNSVEMGVDPEIEDKEPRLIRTDWLRVFATGVALPPTSASSAAPMVIDCTAEEDASSGVFQEATSIKHKELLCEHGKLRPTQAHEFKMLPKKVYDGIVKAVAEEFGMAEEEVVDHQIDGANYECHTCVTSYKENLATIESGAREWNALAEVFNTPEADVDHKHLHQSALHKLYRVSSHWMTNFKNVFESKCKKVMKDDGNSQLLTTELFSFNPQGGGEPSSEEDDGEVTVLSDKKEALGEGGKKGKATAIDQ